MSFHTFQATQPNESEGGKGARPPGARRISTTNACSECRRRKIRCDGSKPCGQCIWYQHPEACLYSKPAQRIVPSRKLIDKLSTSVEQYQAVFCRLFPNKTIDQVASLSREDLILALTLPSGDDSSPVNHQTGSIGVDTLTASPDTTPRSDDVESLEALNQAPDHDPDLDEAQRHQIRVQGISDDVNGLSLSVDRQSSYVGASSITAALKVIFKVAPAARRIIAQNHTETAMPSRANSPSPNHHVNLSPTYLPSAEVGHALIESYFSRVHVLMPMVDEQAFYNTWLYGERKDAPWLALLNTVFALGSIAASDSDSELHIAYFRRARQHIDIDSLGSGNILMVQALGLLSGYYLHYVNRPNLANNLMGATLRQATVLGLHREYADKGVYDAFSAEAVPADIRRKTWWSLFILDCWASTTTGRPSLNHSGPGITVKLPDIKDSNGQVSNKILPLISNIAFCKLATRIQDALAATPLLNFDELASLDSELVKWHDDLPSVLRPVSPPKESNQSSRQSRQRAALQRDPLVRGVSVDELRKSIKDSSSLDILRTPRAIMHWRYQNLRLLLHRPYLLATSLRRKPYASLSAEEKVGVGKCRAIASRTISDISEMCEEQLISGWNSVWFMYQAAMIPLVSLFSVLSASALPAHTGHMDSPGSRPGTAGMTPEHVDSEISNERGEDVRNWQHQIETALAFFDRMEHWSVAAKKSKEVVARLYEASKQLSEYNASQRRLGQADVQTQDSNQLLPGQASFATGQIPAFNTTMSPDFGAGTNQNFMPGSADNSMAAASGVWGLSPNGDAALSNFWFDDMQWDFPMAESGMPEDSGACFGASELDWFSTFGTQDGGGASGGDFQSWDSNGFNQKQDQF